MLAFWILCLRRTGVLFDFETVENVSRVIIDTVSSTYMVSPYLLFGGGTPNNAFVHTAVLQVRQIILAAIRRITEEPPDKA